NKAGNKNGVRVARGKAYVLGRGDPNPDLNVVKGTFLLNNHYAVLFDSGADRGFMSSTFSTLLDIIFDTLDVSYAVELADSGVFKTNIVLRGCTLGLLGHPFNVDLMPVKLGSFNVIIGMDCPQLVSATKLPILNPNEFDLWKMRIEQYFLMTDYSLWEVTLNGDSPVPTRLVEGVAQPVAPTTVEQ
nr:reverse transcriptase domain-containing protein [Tanacetum cinerariifolium]